MALSTFIVCFLQFQDFFIALEEALVITPELDGVTPSLGWDASVLCRGILKSALGDSQVCPALWKVD